MDNIRTVSALLRILRVLLIIVQLIAYRSTRPSAWKRCLLATSNEKANVSIQLVVQTASHITVLSYNEWWQKSKDGDASHLSLSCSGPRFKGGAHQEFGTIPTQTEIKYFLKFEPKASPHCFLSVPLLTSKELVGFQRRRLLSYILFDSCRALQQ